MASGEFDRITEMKERRVERTVVAEWGAGTFYNRLVACPIGIVEDAKLSVLALGAVMFDRFWKTETNETLLQQFPDSNGVGPEVPRLFEVRERQPIGRDGDVGPLNQQLELVYLGFDPKSGETVANDWVETARHTRNRQYTIETDVWGIALTDSSSGIPALGGKLDSNTVVLGGIFNDVAFDDERYPGRTLVHLHATQDRGFA